MVRRARFAIAVAVAWTGIALGAFGYFFSRQSAEDVVGWIIAMLVLQLPAFWALASANPEPRGVLDKWRVAALAIPAAIVASYSLLLGIAVLTPIFDEVLVALLVVVFALVLVIIVFALRRAPHPDAARWVVAGVAIAAAALLLAVLREEDISWDPEFWLLLVLTPLAWTVPLWPFLRRPRPIPEARVRR